MGYINLVDISLIQGPLQMFKTQINSLKCEGMFSFLSVPPAGGCWARVVTVSPGPLIRVEGQPVSIRCDVREYGGPREQVNHVLLLRISHLLSLKKKKKKDLCRTVLTKF